MDTLELIRTFREVAQRGSFSMAAKTLDVSKANVSKYVAALEAKLGSRLLNRSTRTVSLTDAGSLLMKRSTPLLEMIDLTRDELKQRSRLPSGRLRLTAPIGLGTTELPALLADFIRRYPDVHISLDLNNRVIDMVDEGLDIALRIGRITDANLIVRKLRQVSMAVCASPAYWAKRGKPAHPDELAEHDTLTYSLLGTAPEWRFTVNGEAHTVPIHSRMDATDSAPLIEMALQDLGVVCMPRLLMQKHITSGALQPVLDAFDPGDLWLYAAYTQRRHNSAALKALLAFMEERWRGV
ncbi:MAG: LysR substrate-binding domain-containing protein [Pseudomonadota bacterium]